MAAGRRRRKTNVWAHCHPDVRGAGRQVTSGKSVIKLTGSPQYSLSTCISRAYARIKASPRCILAVSAA